jgi:opacity protein-like surface antigen
MKKITILLAFAFLVCLGTTNAQNKIKVGGSLGYSTNISSLGIGVDGVYKINDKFSAAADFIYYLESDFVTWMTIDANAHYNLVNKEKSNVYGLAGLALLMGSYSYDLGIYGSGSSSYSRVGLNVGTGIDYKLTDKLSLMGEAKYVLITGGFLNIRAGVLYNL